MDRLECVVRGANIDEAGALVELFRGAGLVDASGAERLRAAIASRLNPPSASAPSPAIALVAMADGKIVGALYASDNGLHAFLSHLAVRTEWRRKQVGRALHEELARECKARQLRGIVADSWLTSAGFFHRLGYRQPGAVFLITDLGE